MSNIEIPKTILENWPMEKLENHLIIIRNGLSKKQNKKRIGYPVTRIETTSGGKLNSDKVGYIEYLSKVELEKYRIKNGDILLSNINSDIYLGRSVVYNGYPDFLFHGMNLLLLRLRKTIMPNFLKYLFDYYKHSGVFIGIASRAVNQSSINITKLKNLLIPIATLETQKLIVSKIEELFTLIDTGVASFKRIRKQLWFYRLSILKSAFEGKLVEINSFKIGELSEFIERINPGFACGMHFKSSEGLIHFRPYNITINGDINLTEVKKVDPAFNSKRLEFGDVVFNNTNSPKLIGKTCYYDRKEKIGYSNHMTRIKVKQNLLNFKYLAKYLHYLYLTGFYHEIMRNHVNQASVNIRDLRELEFKCPSLSIQESIINKIECRFSIIDKLSDDINFIFEKSDHLKKSILKIAFEGKLTKHDFKNTLKNDLPNLIKKAKSNINNEMKSNKKNKQLRLDDFE